MSITPGQPVTTTFTARSGSTPASIVTPAAQVYVGSALTVITTAITNPELGVYFVEFTAPAGWTHGQTISTVLSGTIDGAPVKLSKMSGVVDTLTTQTANDAKKAKNYSAANL